MGFWFTLADVPGVLDMTEHKLDFAGKTVMLGGLK